MRIKEVTPLKSQILAHTPNFQRKFALQNAFLTKKRVFRTSSSRLLAQVGFLASTFAPNLMPLFSVPSQSLSRPRHDKRSDSYPSTHLAFALRKGNFLLIVASWLLCRGEIPIVLSFCRALTTSLFFHRSSSFIKAYFYWVSLVFCIKEYLLWTLSTFDWFSNKSILFSLWYCFFR